MELRIVLDYVMWLLLGLVIGIGLHRYFTAQKMNERKELKLNLGPWRERVGEEIPKCEEIISEFGKYHYFYSADNVGNLAERIKFTIDDSYLLKRKDWNTRTPFRDLTMITDEKDWEDWRREPTSPLRRSNLYLLAGLLEEFIFQTVKSELTMENKIKLSNDIKTNLRNYPNNIKDILSIISVALDYDDLLYDYDSDLRQDYINFDCIMWGCKKVMERIHDDIRNDIQDMFNKCVTIPEPPTKSKTRKCSSYKQRKRNQKEKRNEQKTCIKSND